MEKGYLSFNFEKIIKYCYQISNNMKSKITTDFIRIICFTAIFIFTACEYQNVFKKYHKFPEYYWDKSVKPEFQFEIDDTVSMHYLWVEVRHATYYPYDDLKVRLHFIEPDKDTIVLPLIIPLKDEKGKFLGQGAGDIWDYRFPVLEGFQFDKTGTYHILLENDEVENQTVAIMEIGVVLRKKRK